MQYRQDKGQPRSPAVRGGDSKEPQESSEPCTEQGSPPNPVRRAAAPPGRAKAGEAAARVLQGGPRLLSADGAPAGRAAAADRATCKTAGPQTSEPSCGGAALASTTLSDPSSPVALASTTRQAAAKQEADEAASEVAAQRKAEESLAACDQATYESLLGLLEIVRSPGFSEHTGLQPWVGTPEPQLGCTTAGLLFDLSRQQQRLVTPFGALTLSYSLCFPGYLEPSAPPPAQDEHLTPLPGRTLAVRPERTSLFFALCSSGAPHLLALSKQPGPRFAVDSVLGAPLPAGGLRDAPASEHKAMRERWSAVTRASRPNMAARLTASLQTPGTPIINELTGRCDAVRLDLLPRLKQHRAFTCARTKPSEEDLVRAMRAGGNEVEKAARHLRAMRRAEDGLVSQRRGYVTRAQVREVLQTCDYDERVARLLLDSQRQVSRVADDILAQSGLESGIGWPTRPDVEARLAMAGNDEVSVLAALIQENRASVEMMAEIITSDTIDRFLAPERASLYGLSSPPTTEERRRVEALYDEFGRSEENLHHFLFAVGQIVSSLDNLTTPAWRLSVS